MQLYSASAQNWPESLIHGEGRSALVYTEETYDFIIAAETEMLEDALKRLPRVSAEQKDSLETMIKYHRDTIDDAIEKKRILAASGVHSVDHSGR